MVGVCKFFFQHHEMFSFRLASSSFRYGIQMSVSFLGCHADGFKHSVCHRFLMRHGRLTGSSQMMHIVSQYISQLRR